MRNLMAALALSAALVASLSQTVSACDYQRQAATAQASQETAQAQPAPAAAEQN